MLHLLDAALEGYLREATPLRRDEIDVVFVAPDRDWAASVARPTVNVFLWDIRRSATSAQSGTEVIERDGVRMQRLVPPRFELRYLVTAWTTAVRDEHQLLGAVLAALVGTERLPSAHLPAPLDEVHPPPAVSVGTHTEGERQDLWSAVGGQLKPALDLTLTATVDAGLAIPLAPAVVDLSLRTRRIEPEAPARPPSVVHPGEGSTDGPPEPARGWRWRLRRRGGQPDTVVRQRVPAQPGTDDATGV